MNTTILAFLLAMSFFVAILWPDKEVIVGFFSKIRNAISGLAGKIRFGRMVSKANRNLRRKNK